MKREHVAVLLATVALLVAVFDLVLLVYTGNEIGFWSLLGAAAGLVVLAFMVNAKS